VLSLDCFNVLNLLDKTWGGYYTIVSEDLYAVNRFDPATQSYAYQVNTNYGRHRYDGNGFSRMLGAGYVF
jgi:hypothetical protein